MKVFLVSKDGTKYEGTLNKTRERSRNGMQDWDAIFTTSSGSQIPNARDIEFVEVDGKRTRTIAHLVSARVLKGGLWTPQRISVECNGDATPPWRGKNVL